MKWDINPDDRMQIALAQKAKIAFVLEPMGDSYDVFAYPLSMDRLERGKHLGKALDDVEAKKMCYDHIFHIRSIKTPIAN